jgi:hypothetical protein
MLVAYRVVDQAKKCRAEKGDIALSTTTSKLKGITKLQNVSNYAEIQKLLKSSEITQKEHIQALLTMQSVPPANRPEPFHCPRQFLCPGGVSNHIVHEQKEKMAVERGCAASNVELRSRVCRHGVHCLFTFWHLVQTIYTQHKANHLMKLPVIVVEQGALWA